MKLYTCTISAARDRHTRTLCKTCLFYTHEYYTTVELISSFSWTPVPVSIPSQPLHCTVNQPSTMVVLIFVMQVYFQVTVHRGVSSVSVSEIVSPESWLITNSCVSWSLVSAVGEERGGRYWAADQAVPGTTTPPPQSGRRWRRMTFWKMPSPPKLMKNHWQTWLTVLKVLYPHQQQWPTK